MRRPHHLALLVIVALTAAWLATAADSAPSPRLAAAPIPKAVDPYGEYLIQFTPRAAQRSVATQRLRSEGISFATIAPNLFVSLAVMSPAEAALAATAPGVVSVSPNAKMKVATTTQPTPPWGLDRIDQTDLPLDARYTHSDSAGSGTTLYIVDSGINAAHVDFAGRIATGYDDVQDGYGTDDCYGHGTHVTGSAAGTTSGVAKLATIVPVRVLTCSGDTTAASVLRGIDWIITHHTVGQAVANFSLGGVIVLPVVDAALAALVADGVAVVVAAGNSSGGNACDASPARAPIALTVGATTRLDARSGFSAIGSCVDLFAPGSGIVSAWIGSPTASFTLSGTSMAAPHVAGALAVLWADHPALGAAQVQELLVATAVQGRLTNIGVGSPNLLLHLTPPIAAINGSAATGFPAERCAVSPTC